MANENILEETKKVLEHMRESEEKLSLLQEDLNQNRNLHQQMTENLRELRELNNKSAAQLEDNTYLKLNIKNSNKQLLTFAQQIYSCHQESYTDLMSHETEIMKNEELLCKSKDMIDQKSKKYETMEETLKKELEVRKTKEMQNTERNQLEGKELIREYEEIQAQKRSIIENINHLNNFIKGELVILEDERYTKNVLEELQELIKSKENEIGDVSKVLHTAKQIRERSEKEKEVNISELDHRIKVCETETERILSSIEDYQSNIEILSKKNNIEEENGKNKKEELNDCENKLNNIEINLKDLEENNKTITSCENSFLKNENICRDREKLKEKIKLDIFTFKEKVKVQQQCIEEISEFLSQNKRVDNTDLNTELEARENKKKELKMIYQKLKEDYEKRIVEFECDVKHTQNENEAREQINKKLQEDTDVIILDLNQLKSDMEQLAIEKERQSRKIEELDNQIKHITLEIAEKKRESQKMKKKINSQPSSTSETRKLRHWDSDSSVEEGRIRYSEIVKQKLKMKKMKKT